MSCIEYSFCPNAHSGDKSAKVTIPLKIGEEYVVVAGVNPRDGTNYGQWKLERYGLGRLHFSDENGALLSIPCAKDKTTPAPGWHLIPEP